MHQFENCTVSLHVPTLEYNADGEAWSVPSFSSLKSSGSVTTLALFPVFWGEKLRHRFVETSYFFF